LEELGEMSKIHIKQAFRDLDEGRNQVDIDQAEITQDFMSEGIIKEYISQIRRDDAKHREQNE